MTNILDETRSQIARNFNARPLWARIKSHINMAEGVSAVTLLIKLRVKSSCLFAMSFWSRLIGFGSSAVCAVSA